MEKWTDSFSIYSTRCYLPFHMMWAIWKAQILLIFEGENLSILGILQQISYSMQVYGPSSLKIERKELLGPVQPWSIPVVSLMGLLQNMWVELVTAYF